MQARTLRHDKSYEKSKDEETLPLMYHGCSIGLITPRSLFFCFFAYDFHEAVLMVVQSVVDGSYVIAVDSLETFRAPYRMGRSHSTSLASEIIDGQCPM